MRIWALVDEKPGNRTQSLGVAEALAARQPGSAFEVKQLELGALSRLPNRMLGKSLLGYTAASREEISAPYPDVAIAAGRRLVPALRAIKAASPATRIVYLMDPQVPLSLFDLVAMPAHDQPPALPNVMATTGSVHRMHPARMAAAVEEAKRFAHLSHPRIALLAGGDTGDCRFTAHDWMLLGTLVRNLAEEAGASLLATTSRRTGDTATQILMTALPADTFFHRWQPEGENPYHAMLATADALVVTGESMSMISEACALGKPVFIFTPEGGVHAKHARFHTAVLARGYAQALTDQSTLAWKPPAPLDEAGRVADAILAIKA